MDVCTALQLMQAGVCLGRGVGIQPSTVAPFPRTPLTSLHPPPPSPTPEAVRQRPSAHSSPRGPRPRASRMRARSRRSGCTRWWTTPRWGVGAALCRVALDGVAVRSWATLQLERAVLEGVWSRVAAASLRVLRVCCQGQVFHSRSGWCCEGIIATWVGPAVLQLSAAPKTCSGWQHWWCCGVWDTASGVHVFLLMDGDVPVNPCASLTLQPLPLLLRRLRTRSTTCSSGRSLARRTSGNKHGLA